MSFFGKIKQGLGIGTASIELTVPGQVARESGEVRGKLTVTAKSDQKVKSVSVKLVETYTKGTGENRTVKEYVLGEMPIGPGTFDLKTSEQKEIEFVLPFSLNLSSAQALAEKGGVLGALGKAAVFTSNEKSEFHLKAWADLEGVALDPVDVKRVELK
jgi:sporulation-control protein spo0M